MTEIKKYRGVRPASLIRVLEGNGVDIPYEEVDYVIVFQGVAGLERQTTLGKVVPLTPDEIESFNSPSYQEKTPTLSSKTY